MDDFYITNILYKQNKNYIQQKQTKTYIYILFNDRLSSLLRVESESTLSRMDIVRVWHETR